MNIPAIVWYLFPIGGITGLLAWSYTVLTQPEFLLHHNNQLWKIIINVLYVLITILISGAMAMVSWLVVTLGAMAIGYDLAQLGTELLTMVYATVGGIFGAIGTHIWMVMIRSSKYAADKVESVLVKKTDDYGND